MTEQELKKYLLINLGLNLDFGPIYTDYKGKVESFVVRGKNPIREELDPEDEGAYFEEDYTFFVNYFEASRAFSPDDKWEFDWYIVPSNEEGDEWVFNERELQKGYDNDLTLSEVCNEIKFAEFGF